jgi:hypothetical protein
MTPSPAPQAAAATTTSSTATPTPSPRTVKVTSSGFSGGVLVTALLSGAVIAAVIAAVINVWLARRKTREEERARVRSTLAEAYQAYAEYKEFPYAIRRRRGDVPAEERVRLSEALRQVQARISYYEAWTLAEHAPTGIAYQTLVAEGRKVAGGAMRDAWKAPGLDNDAGMSIGPEVVNLSALAPYETAFMKVAAAHVEAMGLTWSQRRTRGGNSITPPAPTSAPSASSSTSPPPGGPGS